MHFFLYIHGKWNREVLLPWREVRLGMDPDSDFSFSALEELNASSFPDIPSQILLSPTEEYLRVTADRPLLIQGVEKSSGWLRVNGILRSGPVKIVFKGPVELKNRVQIKPAFGSLVNYYGPGAVSATLALLFITVGLYSFVSSHGSKPLEPSLVASGPVSPDRVTDSSAFTSTNELEQKRGLDKPSLASESGVFASISGNERNSSPIQKTAYIETPASIQLPPKKAESPKEPLPDFPDSLPIVAPGAPIPEIPIKVLFVHAHPDDESIEFGTLMSICKTHGIPTATVLFTDGEGGIFSKEYTGPRTSLRDIRIREAAWALHTLGSALYIRLGLSNLPYNGVRDEQKAVEVLKRWGSSKPTDRMVEIILILKPDIVISPEEPSTVRKHFEHEATALIVKNAIEKVKKMGYPFPKGYLQSLDPRYPLDRKGSISFSRSLSKELQRTALSFHRTQADAFYFGVQRIEKYPEEMYRVKFWDLSDDPHRYFPLE